MSQAYNRSVWSLGLSCHRADRGGSRSPAVSGMIGHGLLCWNRGTAPAARTRIHMNLPHGEEVRACVLCVGYAFSLIAEASLCPSIPTMDPEPSKRWVIGNTSAISASGQNTSCPLILFFSS